MLLGGLVLLAHGLMGWLGVRPHVGPREVDLHFERVELDATGFAPLRLAGAWRLTADDPRFGGVSALALDGNRFVALSDAGSVLGFGRPGTDRARVSISSLPGGPGPANRKRGRDSESLARDPMGGWWVGFEQRHSLFRFDNAFGRLVGRIDLGNRWADNRGVEAMVAPRDGPLLLIPEAGDTVIELNGGKLRESSLFGAGPVSDAAVLPDGRVLLLLRRVTPLGFGNALALLERGAHGYRLSRPLPLPLGSFDNGEAIAVEPRPDGTVRLWLMTDNDFRPSRRTLLIAIDVPRGALGAPRKSL